MIQSGSCKGQAVREAVSIIDADFVPLINGDETYRPSDAPRMLKPLLKGDTDHVIGNRFAGMTEGAMTRLNYVGNQFINRAFTYIPGASYTIS